MALRSSEPAPDSELLPSVESVGETVPNYGALTTETLSNLDRFRSDLSVVDIFREVDAWKVFTGYVSSAVDFEEQLAMWVVGHRIKHNERSRNVVY